MRKWLAADNRHKQSGTRAV